MSLTESHMLPLEVTAPAFNLLDVVSNKKKSLAQLKGKSGTLIVFMCNHCPYVVHLLGAIIELAEESTSKEIATVGISSNNVETHPQDSPEKMKQLAIQKKFGFPYLFDETQQTALDYQVACTPDFYLFDADLKLCYRGRFDDSRPGNNIPISGKDIKAAINNLSSGKPPMENQMPSMGCNIKWRKGNEPKGFV